MSAATLAAAGLDQAALERWGERLGRDVRPPLLLALSGELGAGKSLLARAIARGAGIGGALPSPTFNLLYRYAAPDGRQVVHMDLYRLNHADDVWELGWRELPADDEIVLVEWPERAGALLPPDRWDIHIEAPAAAPGTRAIRAVRRGRAPDLPPPLPDR